MQTLIWLLILAVTPNLVFTDDDIFSSKNGGFDFASKHSIYYNPKTKLPLKIELDESSRFPGDPLRFVARGLPCSCEDLNCGCCAGMNITTFNFTKQACLNFTMVPEEFAIDIRLLIDEAEMFTRRLSARNPPPVCVPLYSLPFVNFCIRFFDIAIVDSTLKTCMDFETKVAQWPIFILHFDCVKFGSSGISWIKPNSTGTFVQPTGAEGDVFDEVAFEPEALPISKPTSGPTPEVDNIGTLKRFTSSRMPLIRPTAILNFVKPTVAHVEIFDEVFFEPEDVQSANIPSGLTPEEEDKIGTLKL